MTMFSGCNRDGVDKVNLLRDAEAKAGLAEDHYCLRRQMTVFQCVMQAIS